MRWSFDLNGVRRGLERRGRELLIRLVGLLLGVRRREVLLPARPRILVVRLDERVGNLVLVTPLLSSLRARFPAAEVDLLAHHRGAELLAGHAALSRYIDFDKRRLFARHGPLRTPFSLRRRRYDVAIDAANPTDPSTTQALLVALCGARHTVGFDARGFGQLYSAKVALEGEVHEIDMRLRLLTALPGTIIERQTSLGRELGARAHPREAFVLLNVGARLGHKRLDVMAYAELARCALELGLGCVLSYGPAERELAQEVAAAVPKATLAPPTTLLDLASLMAKAMAVISCDTGPMHIAVAAGAPTCGLFLCTCPRRYGYDTPPHLAVDTRARAQEEWIVEVRAWLSARARAAL